jgi:ribonuclease HI
VAPSTSHSNTWIAYTDGACRGNPGPSSGGAHLIAPDGSEHNLKKTFGIITNNQAEYLALIMALEELVTKKAENVIVRADSELVIKQVNGIYKVKHPEMKPLHAQVMALAKKFPKIHFEHVRREANQVADALANAALDEA